MGAVDSEFGRSLLPLPDMECDEFSIVIAVGSSTGAGVVNLLTTRQEDASVTQVRSIVASTDVPGLDAGSRFGSSLAYLWTEHDNSSVVIAVGSRAYSGGQGRVHILWLDASSAEVLRSSAIDRPTSNNGFGSSVASLPGVGPSPEAKVLFAVGSPIGDGEFHICWLLRATGTCENGIFSTTIRSESMIHDKDINAGELGSSLALYTLPAGGAALAVGAVGVHGIDYRSGAVYIYNLNPNNGLESIVLSPSSPAGRVVTPTFLAGPSLNPAADVLGASVAMLGDIDGNGNSYVLAVGSPGYGAASNYGALYLFWLSDPGQVVQKADRFARGDQFAAADYPSLGYFGRSVAALAAPVLGAESVTLVVGRGGATTAPFLSVILLEPATRANNSIALSQSRVLPAASNDVPVVIDLNGTAPLAHAWRPRIHLADQPCTSVNFTSPSSLECVLASSSRRRLGPLNMQMAFQSLHNETAEALVLTTNVTAADEQWLTAMPAADGFGAAMTWSQSIGGVLVSSPAAGQLHLAVLAPGTSRVDSLDGLALSGASNAADVGRSMSPLSTNQFVLGATVGGNGSVLLAEVAAAGTAAVRSILASPDATFGAAIAVIGFAEYLPQEPPVVLIGAPGVGNASGAVHLATTNTTNQSSLQLVMPAPLVARGGLADRFGRSLAWAEGLDSIHDAVVLVGKSGGVEALSLQLAGASLADDLVVVATTQLPLEATLPAHTNSSAFGAALAWLGDIDNDGSAHELAISGAGGIAVAWVAAGPDLPWLLSTTWLDAAPLKLPVGLVAPGLVSIPGTGSFAAGPSANGSVVLVSVDRWPLAAGDWGGRPTLETAIPNSTLSWRHDSRVKLSGQHLCGRDWWSLRERPCDLVTARVDALGSTTGHWVPCTDLERSTTGNSMSCTLPPSLDPSLELRLSVGGRPAVVRPSVGIDATDAVVASASATAPLAQVGGATTVFFGFNLLPGAVFDDAAVEAAGAGEIWLGDRYRCPFSAVTRTPHGSSISCSSMPAGVGGPWPVRLSLGSGRFSTAALNLTYEAAVVTGCQPPFVRLTVEDTLQFNITGSRFGHGLDDVTKVVIGGHDCLNVTWHSSALITCEAVNGYLQSHDIDVVIGGLSSSGGEDMVGFHEITSIVGVSQAVVQTVGGVNVSCCSAAALYAEDVRAVFVDGTPCDAWAFPGTQLVCTVPPGTGSSLHMTIETRGGIRAPSSLPVISYAPPAVERVEPSVAFANPASVVNFTFVGSGFGTAQTTRSAVLGGKRCPTLRFGSDSSITCVGAHGPWLSQQDSYVIVDGQRTNIATGLVDFQDQPDVVQAVPATLPTRGGAIVITGSGFGTTLQDISGITIGSRPCVNISVVAVGTKLGCIVEAGVGTDNNVTVATFLNGASPPRALVSFLAPTIDAVAVAGGAAATFANLSSVDLELDVSNCGTSAAALDVQLFQAGAGSTWTGSCAGGVEAAGLEAGTGQVLTVLCRHVSLATFPEAGGQLGATVTLAGQASTSASTLQVIGRPTISTISPSLDLPTSGAAGVEMTGTNFGLSASDVLAVTVGAVTATQVEFLSSQQLRFTVPPGVGASVPVTVTTRGGQRSPSSVPVSYSSPVVSAVEPRYALTGVGTASFNVSGEHFGHRSADLESIAVGSASCESVEWVSATLATCLGANRNDFVSQVVEVVVAGQSGSAAVFEPVLAPVLRSVETDTNSVPTAGLAGVALKGNAFGKTSADEVANVTLGGVLCPVEAWEDEYNMRVTLPPGVGTRHALTVTTVTGLESNAVLVSYQAAEVQSIDPFYALTGTGNASFNITGFDLGNAEEDLTAIVVGGQPCAQVRWVSPAEVHCINASRAEWTDKSVTVTVGEQQGLKNSYFQAVPAPTVTEVTPVVASVGDELLILGEDFGFKLDDVANVTVAESLCTDLHFTGPTALRCRLPLPSPRLQAAAAEDPRTLRAMPVVVYSSSGQRSDGSGVVSYAGSGNPISEQARHIEAWRPVGRPGSFVVRWSFPLDSEMVGVDPVESFQIRQELLDPAADVLADTNTSLSVAVGDMLARGDILDTNDSRRLFKHSDFAADELPLRLQIRAVNPTGAGPWSEWSAPVTSNCMAAEFLQTHAPAEQQLCAPCPSGAFCGGSTAETVTALPGHWRVPWSRGGLGFAACPRPDSCLGYEAPALGAAANTSLARGDAAAARRLDAFPRRPRRLSQELTLAEALARESVPTALDERLLGEPQAMEACQDGYAGTLCATCVQGYTRWGGFGCRKCKSGALVGLAMAGLAVLVFLIVSYLIVSAIKSGAEATPIGTAAIKVVFSHLQTVAIASAFDLQWPDSVRGLFAGLTSATSVSSEVLSLDCVMPSSDDGDSTSYSSRFFDKAAIVLAMPLVMLAVAAAAWRLTACSRAAEDRKFLSGPQQATASDLIQNPLSNRSPKRPKPRVSALWRVATPAQSSRAAVGGLQLATQVTAPRPAPPLTAAASRDKATTRAAEAADVGGLGGAGSPTSAGSDTSGGLARQRPPLQRGRSLASMLQTKLSLSSTALGVELTFWDRFVTSAVVILFLVHMSVTTTSLQLLTCRDIVATGGDELLPGAVTPAAAGPLGVALERGCSAADTQRRLVADLEVCCHDKEAQRRMFGLGIPGLLLYAFGIPIGSAVVLFLSQHKLHQHHTQVTLGFLFAGFRQETYFWESVVMLRKVLVATIAVALEPLGVTLQTYTALMLIFGLALLHAWLKPYRQVLLNRLEMGALVTAFVTFECGLFLTDDGVPYALAVAATLTIFFANLCFLMAAAWIIASDKLCSKRRQQQQQQ